MKDCITKMMEKNSACFGPNARISNVTRAMLGVFTSLFRTRRKLQPPKKFESAQGKFDSTHQYSFLFTFLFNFVGEKSAFYLVSTTPLLTRKVSGPPANRWKLINRRSARMSSTSDNISRQQPITCARTSPPPPMRRPLSGGEHSF